MNIAIIGGGWYGCHLATVLLKAGHSITLLEKTAEIFSGSSQHNQNRLHLGYHYPRSAKTREQVFNAYDKFMTKYGQFTRTIDTNIYAISAQNSLVDFLCYKQILKAANLAFHETEPAKHGLVNVEGAIVCQERLIDATACRDYFKVSLTKHARTSYEVNSLDIHRSHVEVNGEPFDWAINCTYNQFRPNCAANYELTIMYHYLDLHNRNRAITIMDGQFPSLYPTSVARQYSLSAVPFTPLVVANNFADVNQPVEVHQQHRSQFEQLISHYLPSFLSEHVCIGYVASHKAKLAGVSADSRELVATTEGQLITLWSGKISNIFTAEAYVTDRIRS
jgi:hypothetical protein